MTRFMAPERSMTYRFFRFSDILVPVFALMVILISSQGGARGSDNQLMMEIHSGDSVAILPLDSDTLLQVSGNLGPLSIRIENCRARMESSPCQGQDCVLAGWLDSSGDLAICVPSGVFLVITSTDSPNGSPDAVSY